MKEQYYYYFDEHNDDFAGTDIDHTPTPKDTVYYHDNFFYKIGKAAFYYPYLGICRLAFAIMGVHLVNRKCMKKVKKSKKGYYIYGNHTGFLEDAMTGPCAAFPKQCYTIVSSDTINIKGIRPMTFLWGALPVPAHKETYFRFLKDMRTINQKGYPVQIYPEAHIWPKYNGLRDISSVSFTYPVENNAPCFAKTTVYTKKKNGRVKTMVIFDGPFYPDTSLNRRSAIEKLKNEVWSVMRKRIEEYSSVLPDNYHYVRVNSPEEVRTETFKRNKECV